MTRRKKKKLKNLLVSRPLTPRKRMTRKVKRVGRARKESVAKRARVKVKIKKKMMMTRRRPRLKIKPA